jgi:hypothetical protein
VTEAATNVPWLALCEDVVRALTFHARDLLPLRDVTLQIIALVDGKRDPGLAVVNQCLRNGLLKSVLMAPDGTMKPLASSDWGPPPKRTVGAPHNPAEGVYVEPYEAGLYFVRRVDPAKLATNPAKQPPLVAAVENRLEKHQPGKGGNEQWKRFCDEVRQSCGKKATDRGYSDKTIKRIVAASTNRTNRQDKQDI